MGLTKPIIEKDVHEDFGVLVDTQDLFNTPLGDYHVAKPLDLQTYQSSEGYSALFTVFPLIIGTGSSGYEARESAKRHLLHSRNFYESLAPERGTPGAKRQSQLMKQYLQ